jgi:hypothetical protein
MLRQRRVRDAEAWPGLLRRSLLMALTLAALGSVMFASAVDASTARCVVTAAGAQYGTLQEAVNAASPGDTLEVTGTCYGDTSITKNVSVVGKSGKATLNGGNSSQHPGSVIFVREATVNILRLVITGGYNSECVVPPERCENSPKGEYTSETAEKGGGIENLRGEVTLSHSTVSANVAAPSQYNPSVHTFGGGGIYNEEGSLTLIHSTVSGNEGLGKGGGINNEAGTLTLTDSTVSGNATRGSERGIGGSLCNPGGGIFNNGGGVVTIAHSTVSDNQAGGELCGGGGIYNEGSVKLSRSVVESNVGNGLGGGITNPREDSSVILDHSSLSGNTAKGGDGGGIANAGQVTLDDSIIAGNSATGHEIEQREIPEGYGGGIYNVTGSPFHGPEEPKPLLTLNGSSSVFENTAAKQGGGIYNNQTGGATITFGSKWTGSVSGNEPDNIFNA